MRARSAGIWAAGFVLLGVAAPAVGAAERQAVKLSTVLTSFLADAGLRTRGLPWTTGAALPVKWETARPVASPEPLAREGLPLGRSGEVRVVVGDQEARPATLQLYGNANGLQRVAVVFHDADMPESDAPERSLAAEKIGLELLKCDPKTELASGGNLLYVLKAPGKTASALVKSWDCGSSVGCSMSLILLYRKADVAQYTCFGEN
jgi:hypothetical protein